ncbi:MAG: CPBP family glutamic-type intramembrane protease [Candidatus Marsarchaeota archaeon]|nr:CPBP family glutamic-type intramembrane protease [Candidatus Marsarchaeota archaeon]
MNALLFLLFIIVGYLLLLKVRLKKPTIRQFLISLAAAGVVLFVSSVFSFSNLDFSGRLIPFFLVLVISEEIIFRGVLDDLIGLWQIPLYALVMPFVYSTPFFLTFLALLVEGGVATIIKRRINLSSAIVYRIALLFFFVVVQLSNFFVQESFILVLALLLGWKGSKTLQNLSFNGFKKKHLIEGAFVFLVLFSLLIAMAFVLYNFNLLDTQNVANIIEKQNGFDLFMAVTLGPVAEELFFRGFLQKRIGVFLTSVVFALLHTGYGSIAEVLGAFIASMVFGWWVKKHDDVAPTIIAHAFYNMLSILSII